MNWLNISVTTCHDEVFLGATPVEKGIWLSLALYCAAQENGGAIVGCDAWTDRQWMAACGLTKADITTPSRLWTWNPTRGCMWVYAYPAAQEAIVKAKRKGGMKGAKRRWKPKNVVVMEAESPG